MDLADGAHPSRKQSLRPFWFTLILLNAGLIIAAFIAADRLDVPGRLAVPVAAAFLVQISVCLVPLFPPVRLYLEDRFSSVALASLLVATALTPYLIYSLPSGVFSLRSFATLLAFSGAVAFIYVLAPPREHRLSWQDVIVLALLAYPMVSGLSDMFKEIYPNPGGNVPGDVYAIGKIMLISLGAMVFLSLRPLRGTNYQLAISRSDFRAGLKNYLLFLPIGIPLALGIGFASWGPRSFDSWTDLVEVAGRAAGLYAAVALSEELYFRGVIQNLLSATFNRPAAAQAVAALLFGLAHISPGFPNGSYVLVAAVAGWFYGRAYSQTQSVVAAAVTHTLVAVTHAFFFPSV